MNYNRILIVGFRCSGKSTISTELSKKLNLEFVDMDSLIEKEQGKKINEITNSGKNWQYFRKLETIKIKELLHFDNVLISAGGGLGVNDIMYNDLLTYGDIQREIIKSSVDTLKIMLFANENVIRERLKNSKLSRPDLKQQTYNEEEYIENNIKIMKEREDNYKNMADIVFDTSNEDVDINVNNLINIINKHIQK